IARIHTINQEWRILVVHNLAVSDDKKSVRFLKHSAKRKLHFPHITKNKAEFEDICTEIFSLGKKIEEVSKDLSRQSVSALAKALATSPIEPTFGLGLAGFPPPPAPGLQHLGLWTSTLGTGLGMLPGLLSIKPPTDK